MNMQNNRPAITANEQTAKDTLKDNLSSNAQELILDLVKRKPSITSNLALQQ